MWDDVAGRVAPWIPPSANRVYLGTAKGYVKICSANSILGPHDREDWPISLHLHSDSVTAIAIATNPLLPAADLTESKLSAKPAQRSMVQWVVGTANGVVAVIINAVVVRRLHLASCVCHAFPPLAWSLRSGSMKDRSAFVVVTSLAVVAFEAHRDIWTVDAAELVRERDAKSGNDIAVGTSRIVHARHIRWPVPASPACLLAIVREPSRREGLFLSTRRNCSFFVPSSEALLCATQASSGRVFVGGVRGSLFELVRNRKGADTQMSLQGHLQPLLSLAFAPRRLICVTLTASATVVIGTGQFRGMFCCRGESEAKGSSRWSARLLPFRDDDVYDSTLDVALLRCSSNRTKCMAKLKPQPPASSQHPTTEVPTVETETVSYSDFALVGLCQSHVSTVTNCVHLLAKFSSTRDLFSVHF